MESIFAVLVLVVLLILIILPIVLIFSIIPIILILKVPKGKSKIAKYRGLSIYFMIIGGVLSLICAGTFISSFDKQEIDKFADSFTIEQFKVKMDVHKDNTVDVEEQILINFLDDSHHGIYRYIPYWLEYTNKEDKTTSRRYDISEIEVLDEEYHTELENGKEKITIGKSDVFVKSGVRAYIIKYKYNMGNDPYKGYDELIFHAFGDFWGTKINNASLEITMPDEIDLSNVKVFLDKYRENDVTNKVNYSVMGNTIYIDVPNDLELTKALTLDIVLPDGYFKDTVSSYGLVSLAICLVIIVVTIITFLKWVRHGKDFKIDDIRERRTPPEGFDVASCGYIYKKSLGGKLIIGTLLELANLKVVKLEDLEEEKDVKVINLKNDKVKLTSSQQMVYDYLFKPDSEARKTFFKMHQDEGDNPDEITVKKAHLIYLTEKFNANLQQELDTKIDDQVAYKNMLITSLFCVFAPLFWFISFNYIKDMNMEYSILYVISLISIALIFVFTILMKRKNTYGETLYSEIDDYRRYLVGINSDDLKNLKAKDINNCNIDFVYAYIFGFAKEFSKKMNEAHPKGDNYYLYYNYSFLDHFNTAGDSSSSSSGCSSCGGGGGGCSSCGGGGSW